MRVRVQGRAGDLQAGDLQAGDLQAGDLQAGDLQAGRGDLWCFSAELTHRDCSSRMNTTF